MGGALIDSSLVTLWPLFAATALYHTIASFIENRQPPPGQLIDVDGRKLHLWHIRSSAPDATHRPTVVLEHSLGGVEGYLLIRRIAEFANVCLCDRAGYGWSEISPKPMTSEERVRSLHIALTKAAVEPPYILVGDSLGSYHMRLFAHQHPDKVAGLVLTDGLHEKALLKMPPSLRLIQLLFFSGFIISIAGSALGLVRLAGATGLFTLIKPDLKAFSAAELRPVLRSFYRLKHWLTMTREIARLNKCGQQLKVAHSLKDLPLISIKAKYFFKPTGLMRLLPLSTIEKLRDEMHDDLMTLSTQCSQLQAKSSSHFVWVDQPDVIIHAVRQLL